MDTLRSDHPAVEFFALYVEFCTTTTIKCVAIVAISFRLIKIEKRTAESRGRPEAAPAIDWGSVSISGYHHLSFLNQDTGC
jgi:hypothetical protein